MSLHNIKIVVVDGGRNGTYRTKNISSENYGQIETKNSPLNKLFNLKQTIKNKVQSGMTPTGVMAFNLGKQIASQLAKQSVNYYIYDIGRKNGDSSLQEHIDREIEIATDLTGLIGNSLSGAATGSMLGIGGTVIGAIAGFAGSAISIGFRQAERKRAFNFQEFKENNSIEYQRARANINLTTGRLR